MLKLGTLLVAVALVAGCSKKDKDAGGGAEPTPAAKQGALAKPAEDKPAAGAKVFDYATPKALDDDWRSVQGAAFMEKFGLDGKFRVTGPVGKIITEEAGNATVWFLLENNKRISLGFADDGKAVKDKGVKEGDTITVSCNGGGSDDNMIMLTDCALE